VRIFISHGGMQQAMQQAAAANLSSNSSHTTHKEDAIPLLLTIIKARLERG